MSKHEFIFIMSFLVRAAAMIDNHVASFSDFPPGIKWEFSSYYSSPYRS